MIPRFALILLLIAPSWVGAAIWDKNARIEKFDRIFVVITDGATGGCWTNIRTARQYAENKLLLADAKAELDHGRQGYGFVVEGVTFAIIINAFRSGGLCNGQIDIELSAINFGNQNKARLRKS